VGEGLGLLERDGAEEGLQHLLHWQGCGTVFISVSARRCVCVCRELVMVALHITS